MKYIVMLGDGMAGEPLEELGGRTTLEAAVTPEMDRLAAVSEIGTVCMVPEEMAPGSDTANLSVMGYDPRKYYTGRSPLEALSIGVELQPEDVAVRCNLVTLSEEETNYEDRRILDHSSEEISTEDAAILLDALKAAFHEDAAVNDTYHFYVGTSYRHLLVINGGTVQELTPPHDILTRRIGEYLPQDPILQYMMKQSYEILEQHPLNQERRRRGLRPANSAWFWGAGTKPELMNFEEKTGKKGVMISAVDLLKGIAVGAGITQIAVEGANGGLHTNYEGKAQAALDALLKEGYDFAYIHVEAPDEMGHQGRTADKIRAIESIDQRILAYLTKTLDKSGEDYRILILSDHPTPIRVRTHTKDPVPYMLYDSRRPVQGAEGYYEKTASESGRQWKKEGYCLLEHLLEN
ncbi:MAG TPA: cofactor-independent phosphoglycerate mutase [Lachnospiraceae bacterium]|nr:cofactor-independent phosphoglycerate mutase [Lachnospiraceae bacterium]